MTKTQLREARKILKADCESQYYYIDGEGKTCAIGALALAAGVSKRSLQAAGKRRIETESAKRIRRAVTKHFGLTTIQLGAIQNLNDESFDILLRRRCVLTYLNDIQSAPVKNKT